MKNRATGPGWMWAVGIALGGLLFAGVLWARPPEVAPEERDELYQRLRVLAEAMDVVQRNYVEPVKPEDLVYGAVEGIVARLDPHSSFMTPDMFQEMQVETEGAFGGLGIEITVKDGRLTVVSPIEDTPAAAAGIQAGDVIVMIEGEPTEGMDLMEAVRRMRGPKGTRITIHILREGWDKPKAFTLTRDIIRIKSVKARRVDGVGVVRITQFQQATHREVAEALEGLRDDPSLYGLVLDLRNNPGGLLDQAVKVADLFLTGGTVVSTKGRDPEQEVVYTARDDGTEPKLPLVVLVNGGTASASEIVAGALQDHRRGLILGERTFGKGSVQTILPLSDGSGLRITTALYYTPSGRTIQARGIEPDVKVAAGPGDPEEVPEDRIHGRMREEDLKGHFEPGQEEGERPPKPEAEEPGGAGEGSDLSQDRQLQRAVQILQALRVFGGMGQASSAPADAGRGP
ncbi:MULTISPECIES: S41 family peptidase [Deferrisoma]